MTDVRVSPDHPSDPSSKDLAPILEREVTELPDGRRITYYRRGAARSESA